jgi:FkbM family methyltransferase
VLKAVRNAAASVGAWALYHVPALEAPYAYAAHAARAVPGVHTLFRETTDRLVDRLSRERNAVRRVRVGDVEALFDVSSFTVKGHYFAHVPYEPGATRVVLDALGPGDTFVDIGANTGYFTVLAAVRVGPRGRVCAFEPNPEVRLQLEHQVSLNGLTDRVIVSDVALSDTDQDDALLYVSCWPENNGVSSLTPPPETVARGGLRADRSVAVRVRTFDSWLSSAPLARIDLLKIDVEGAEAKVLAGMSHAFGRVRPRRIICETQTDSEAAALLRTHGYRMTTLDEIPGGIPNLLFE